LLLLTKNSKQKFSINHKILSDQTPNPHTTYNCTWGLNIPIVRHLNILKRSYHGCQTILS